MKQLLTKTSQGGVKHYITPQTEAFDVRIENAFLDSYNTGATPDLTRDDYSDIWE